jgi:predicted P-loop ATPase
MYIFSNALQISKYEIVWTAVVSEFYDRFQYRVTSAAGTAYPSGAPKFTQLI